jgi:PAS domain S-box-containing protein
MSARAPWRLPGSPFLQFGGAAAAFAVALGLWAGPPSTAAWEAGLALRHRTGELALALQSTRPDRVRAARRGVEAQLEVLAATRAGAPATAAALARWDEVRQELDHGPAAGALRPLAGLRQVADDIAQAEHEAWWARQRQRDGALAAGSMLAAGALVWAGVALGRQRRHLRRLADRVSSDLGSGAWRDAVRSMRNTTLAAPSAFDTMATGFEEVLGESDRRWRALADQAADWYWETDRQHRLTWTSGSGPLATPGGRAAAPWLGRRHDQIDALEPPADGWDRFHALLDSGRAFRDLEFRVRARNDEDEPRWLCISGRPRLDPAGHVLGYEGVGRDISERKRALERLRASEQRWSLMAGLASEYYWETDTEHRMLPLRPEVARRFGPLAAHGEGRTPWQTYPDAMSAAAWDDYRVEVAARRPFSAVEMEIEIDGGGHRFIEVSGTPRFDGHGRFLGYHGIGRDVTLRREAERLMLRHNESLKRAVAERTQTLERLNGDLDAFARHLAHELRTPIGQVQGLAALLVTKAGDRLAAEEMRLVGLQLRAARQMRDTLDALLALARSTAQPLQFETLDLSALAGEVIDELPPLERRAPMRWQVQPGLQVRGSAPALRIVLQNLLGNAAKFTRDVDAPRAGLTGEPGPDGRLRLQVQDNGAGFPADQAERLFQPFSRLHGGEAFEGTGIGLTIVQRIVERHGGTVAARGEPGRGASFHLTLPGVRDAAAAPDART